MPIETNPIDFDSISDVIFHLRYMAKADGGDFRSNVKDLPELTQYHGQRLFSLAQEFATNWYAYKNERTNKLDLFLLPGVFPPNIRLKPDTAEIQLSGERPGLVGRSAPTASRCFEPGAAHNLYRSLYRSAIPARARFDIEYRYQAKYITQEPWSSSNASRPRRSSMNAKSHRMTPFRSPAFRRLWCSGLATLAARGMEQTTTAWLALEAGGGAFGVGFIFAARMLPFLLFGLAAGTIADRADRPRQLLLVAGSGLLLMAAFGWLVGLGTPRVWQVVVFAFAAGCLQVFDTPARQALVVDTVPRETAMRALALTALAARFAVAFGALGAGLLIPWLGVARSYLVIAVAYGVAALLVATLRVPQEHRGGVAHPPFRQAFRDAARLMVDVPAVRTLMIAGIACEIFAFSHMTALPLFAQDVLGAGAEGLGTLNGALSIGGAVAVALLSFLPERVGRQPLLSAIFLLYGVSIIALAATHDLTIAAAVLLVTGFCAGAFDVLQQTLIQMAVPDAQRGRAVGLWVLSIGSAPVGHLEMGTLAAALGVPIALLINGALTAASAATLLARAPDHRWMHLARPRAHGRRE